MHKYCANAFKENYIFNYLNFSFYCEIFVQKLLFRGLKVNRQELAELLNVSRNTLNNWEKEKPELVRLINQGLALDEQVEETKKYLEKLEQIRIRANSRKINSKKIVETT